MTTTVKTCFIIGGVVAALVAGVYLRESYLQKKILDQKAIAQEAVVKASQFEVEAKDAKTDAKIAEETAEVISQKLSKTTADNVALKAKVSQLARLVGEQPQVGAPITDEHVQLDLAKDEYIAGLENETQSQKELIASLETAVDKWKLSSNNFEAALEEERRARRAEQIASSAALRGVKVARWRGRLEGFLVGSALGYAKGRLN